jgi:hypothetical protein
MSSRFERRRPAPGDAAPTVLSPRTDGPTEDERPWQALVRRLRQMMATEETTTHDVPGTASRPVLRVIPGGKSTVENESGRPTELAHGRWRS